MGFYRKERPGPILGRAGFIERLRARGGPKGADCEIPERRHLAVAMEECIKAVAKACGTNVEAIVKSRRGVDNNARRVAMDVCQKIGGYGHGAIARRLGVGSYSTVSSVCAGLRMHLSRDPGLQKWIEMIRHQLIPNYGQKAT